MERMKLPELGHGITPEGLEQLNAAISSGATSEGLLQGLEQQMLRANAMRDQNSGTRAGSPMMAMADSFANITGAVRGRQIGQQQNKQRGTLAKAKAAQAGEEQRRFMRDDSFKVLGKAMDQRRMQEAEGQNDIGNQQWNRNFNRGVLESDRSFNQSEQKRAADEAQQIIDNRRNWRSDNLEHGGGAPDTKIEPWKKGEETKNITERFNPETDRTEPYNVDEDRFIQPGEMEGYTPHKEFNPNSGSGGGLKRGRAMGEKAIATLEDQGAESEMMDVLEAGFDKSFAQIGGAPTEIANNTAMWMSRQGLGALLPGELEKQAAEAVEWRATLDKFVQTPERNRLYGSQLTNYEIQAFKDAQALSVGGDPEQLRKRVEHIASIKRKYFERKLQGRLYRQQNVEGDLGQLLHIAETHGFEVGDDLQITNGVDDDAFREELENYAAPEKGDVGGEKVSGESIGLTGEDAAWFDGLSADEQKDFLK